MVRFGDVVRDVNESERNPLAAGLERFIGLEHIEPENLHLKRWGFLADGEISFTRRFRKGQVLFGKRRAYQRKVVVAEFDGICSSDLLTFEPKDDSLIPELLPFIVQSDGFLEHALGTSSGSLSPRTRWSQLQDYEFPLPPKDEQRRIADILWAADEVIEIYRALLKQAVENENHAFDTTLAQHSRNTDVSVPLERVVARFIDYRGKSPAKTGAGIPLVTAKNVRNGYISLEPREFIAEDGYDEWMRRGIPGADDLLFTTEAPLGFVSRVPRFRFALAQRIICLHPDTTIIDPSFLFWGMRSQVVQRRILQMATGTTVFGIKQSNLRKLLFPLPSRKVQEVIARMCNAMELARIAVESHLSGSIDFRKTLGREMLLP